MPEQVHASHIVKHVSGPADALKANEEIQDIKQQIDDGVPFEELATAHSDCPDSAGDLGFFPRGQMVQEFEEIVFGLKPGEVSEVFATQFGYHIAKVHEKRPAGTASLHEVRDYIAKELTRIRSQKLIEEFVDKLKARAEIIREVND
jgi:parvulin-like peptidyl-prolyl isomerase